MRKKIKLIAVVCAILTIVALGIATIPETRANAQLVIHNSFSPSETTYTNKTIEFTDGADPYNGYSIWTYENGGTVQAPSDNMYAMDTDVSGYAEFFGFDEFVSHSIVSTTIRFKTTSLIGTYHFVPLGYFYQKTALETNTHWALALYWDSTGCDIYYNTGNGNTPSSVSLFATAPEIGAWYTITLQNFGFSTFIVVYEEYSDSDLYNSTITTPTFDARSLYAGFGQYSSGNGHIYGWHDDFILYDTIIDMPSTGYGFNVIDAYIDEVFTHRFYDVETGTDPILDIDSTVTNITLVVQCWLNGTLFDIASIADGANKVRHNVTVTNTNSTIVFSQGNLTYQWGIEYMDDLFLYQYAVQLDFVLTMGEIYTTALTMEVYYVNTDVI